MKAVLALEDGSLFEGLSMGVRGEASGEVILNTAVVGYQEMMSDPANAGKILVLTYPLIGNYGAAKKFYESNRCWISALIIKEGSRLYSNWQAETSFDEFMRREGVVAMEDVDTRTLAVKIRDSGQMFGMVSSNDVKKAELLRRLKSHKKHIKNDYISDISVKKITNIDGHASGPRVGVLDLGILNSFVKQLKMLRMRITLLPYDTDAGEILDLKLDGLVISNGPESDSALPEVASTIKRLLGKLPMLGISTGHEAIGLALGAKLKKMKMGHHGVNYPVRSPGSFKGEITVQNHSFIIDDASLKKIRTVNVTSRNLNDNSAEEMESGALKFLSVQYYPVNTGSDNVHDVFKRFSKMMSGRGRHAKA